MLKFILSKGKKTMNLNEALAHKLYTFLSDAVEDMDKKEKFIKNAETKIEEVIDHVEFIEHDDL